MIKTGSDRLILEREAKAINATMDWYREKANVFIILRAPHGFVWASTSEPELNFDCPYTQSRDAVTELLALMNQGFTKSIQPRHEHDCECHECEDSDEEVFELSF